MACRSTVSPAPVRWQHSAHRSLCSRGPDTSQAVLGGYARCSAVWRGWATRPAQSTGAMARSPNRRSVAFRATPACGLTGSRARGHSPAYMPETPVHVHSRARSHPRSVPRPAHPKAPLRRAATVRPAKHDSRAGHSSGQPSQRWMLPVGAVVLGVLLFFWWYTRERSHNRSDRIVPTQPARGTAAQAARLERPAGVRLSEALTAMAANQQQEAEPAGSKISGGRRPRERRARRRLRPRLQTRRRGPSRARTTNRRDQPRMRTAGSRASRGSRRAGPSQWHTARPSGARVRSRAHLGT